MDIKHDKTYNSGTITITDAEAKNYNKAVFDFTFKDEYKKGKERERNTINGVIAEIIIENYLYKNGFKIDKNHKERVTENGFEYGDIRLTSGLNFFVSSRVFKNEYRKWIKEKPDNYAVLIKSSQLDLYADDKAILCQVFMRQIGPDQYEYDIIGFLPGSEIKKLKEKGEIKMMRKGEKMGPVVMGYNNWVIPIRYLSK